MKNSLRNLLFFALFAHLLYGTVAMAETTPEEAETPQAQIEVAEEEFETGVDENAFILYAPTVVVEGYGESSHFREYTRYEDANITRDGLTLKEIPRTVDVINIQRNKNYGQKDLSAILEGTAGVATSHDMRGDSIYIRGFQADYNDVYRDGVRDSGQIRRSTANVERIEILKGPASILYGRGAGGGSVNMVSKYANFMSPSSVGLTLGVHDAYGANLDVNETIFENFAVRLTGDYSKSNSYRENIGTADTDSETMMFSPSITYSNKDNFNWTVQYTYDNVDRFPDRGPAITEYDKMGISYDKSFVSEGSYLEDVLHVLRSTMEYYFNEDITLKWDTAYRSAEQNFNHLYFGTYDTSTKKLTRNYYSQATSNETLSNNLTLNLNFNTFGFLNKMTIGVDASKETRDAALGDGRKIAGIVDNRVIDPFDPSSWPTLDVVPTTTHNVHDAISMGAFFQNLFHVTDDLKFAFGGRFDYYEFESENKLTGANNSYNGNSFSPNLGLVYDINDNHTVYTSFSRSFAPYGGSGIISINTTSDPSTFNDEPSYNDQYEVGIKSDWFDETLSSTLSFYSISKHNIRYTPDPNDPFTWATRGEERSMGAELSVIGQLFPDLFFRASLGYQDTEIVDDKYTPKREGTSFSGIPHFTGSAFLRYVPEKWNAFAEIGVVHVGDKKYYTSAGAFDYKIDQYTRVDFLAGYNWNDISITLGIQNLFNIDYWASSTMPADGINGTLKLTYTF